MQECFPQQLYAEQDKTLAKETGEYGKRLENMERIKHFKTLIIPKS